MNLVMSEEVYHAWRPIEDYPVPPQSLAKPELRQLAGVWAEQRQELEQIEGLHRFNERLKREWAIETGLIERIYTLDRGVTQILDLVHPRALRYVIETGTKEEAVAATRALCGFKVVNLGAVPPAERRRVARTHELAQGRVFYWVPRTKE